MGIVRFNIRKFTTFYFCSILSLNLIFDFLYYIESLSSVSGILRLVVNASFVFLFFFFYFNHLFGEFKLLAFLLIYWLVLCLFASDIIFSLSEFFKIFLYMMFLPISFFLIKDFKDFQLFIKSCFLVLVLHVILISIANLYNLGEDTIKGNDLGFINLALADSRLFIMAYLVGLMPFFIRFKVLKSNIFWFAIGLLNALSLILSIKRTTIVISSFLFLFGQLFSKNKKNLVYLIIVLSFVSIPLYPYIEPIFMERLESRKYFVSGEYDIEEEGRVLELGLVVDTFLENDSYLNYLFGIEPFNSINNYGFLKDRPIHNDFVYVLFSSGIVGLFLYVYMLVDIYKKFLKKFNKYNSLALVDYKRVFQSIFLMVILVSFIGNMWAITYKIFVFSVFGAFIGCNRKLV